MGCPFYLAITAAEFSGVESPPAHTAWMACHFSPYGKGLSNFPNRLPPDSMLILNDRIPVEGHDPAQILAELAQLTQTLPISRVLLDLQREKNRETEKIVEKILGSLPCPVGVSPSYAVAGYPVFLPPVPPDMPLKTYLEKWEDQEVWLETDPTPLFLEVTKNGCQVIDAPEPPESPEHCDEALQCHYKICTLEDRVRFWLYRKEEDTAALLDHPNIRCGVGLYQQYK